MRSDQSENYRQLRSKVQRVLEQTVSTQSPRLKEYLKKIRGEIAALRWKKYLEDVYKRLEQCPYPKATAQ